MFKYENDSRKVQKGQTFIAIKGLTVDGHDYIDKAISNGASEIICEKDLDIDIPYIKTILDVNTDADSIDWTIYYHSDGSDKEIINKLTQMGIDMNKINVPIKW